MARRRKDLSEEELELWQRVTETAVPLHAPKRNLVLPKAATAKPAPPHHAPMPALRAFEIGQKARPSHPAHDLAPPLPDRLAKAPVRMDRKNFARMQRGKLAPEARIDLHGMTIAAAHPALVRFVLTAQANGKRLVLVITGKGRKSPEDGPIPVRHGILKHQVPMWLGTPPLGALVLQVSEAHQSHGGSGAYYVYLRRDR